MSPCRVAGLAAHVAPQVSPLPAAQLVGKFNGMSEINLFLLLKQPGNASFHQRQPRRWHAVVQWDMTSPGASRWRNEGMGK